MEFKNDFFAISFDKMRNFLSNYNITITNKMLDTLCHDNFKYIKNKKGVYECKKIYSEERIKNSLNGRMKNKFKKLEEKDVSKNINTNKEKNVIDSNDIKFKNKGKIQDVSDLIDNKKYINKDEIIKNINNLLSFQKEISGNINEFILSVEKASPKKIGSIVNENITVLKKETEYITKKSEFVNEELTKLLKPH